MFRAILGTIGTRIVNAILILMISLLNARYLGASNMGTMSLIILAVTYIQLLNNFIGGGALVYMTPRIHFFRLFVSGYAWTFLVTVIFTCIFEFIGGLGKQLEVIPRGYFFPVLFLALVMSLASVNLMLLLGKEKVRAYNILNLIQVFSLVLILLSGIFLIRVRNVMTIYYAYLGSYIVIYLVSLVMILPFLKPAPLRELKKIFGIMLNFGTWVQFANIFQQLNYRMGYYFVDILWGRASVGVLTLGFSLSEGLWIISRSLALVQFSRIANADDFEYSKKLTLTLSKVAIAVTITAVLCLIAIPSFVYTAVFGAAFSAVRTVIITLAVGIVTLSFSMVLSPFFSGINKPYHNTISSAIGLIFTIVFGMIMVPRFGIIGASVAASISYTASTLYQFIIFSWMTRLKLRDFLLTRQEIGLLTLEIKKFLRNRKALEISQ